METDRNSLVSHLTSYVQALSKDIAWAYSTKSDWERDFSRLCHELAQKGPRILTLDMPALGKHFDRCLDQGQYKPSGLPLGGFKGGVQVPAFLQDLYLQVFDQEGKLRDTPSSEVIFYLRTLFMSAKKLRLPFTERSLRDEIHNFIRIEQEIRRPTLAWDCDNLFPDTSLGHSDMQSGWFGGFEGGISRRDPTLSEQRAQRADRKIRLGELADEGAVLGAVGLAANNQWLSRSLAIVQQVADIVVAQFGDLNLERDSELPKHGPGAVAEGGKHSNKYAFPHWPRKLQAMFPVDYYGNPRLGVPLESAGEIVMGAHEPPSRLIAVPKTAKGPRLIAAEPVAHQWIQQLIKSQLEDRLAETALKDSISFRDQSLSGNHALRASIDGSFATIDLSSASDRLSCWLVERVFRVNTPLLLRLHACRTRWLTYKNERGQSEYIRLNKFAPMGSAVTFPVQSIIYAIVAIGAVLIDSHRKVTKRSVEIAARQVRVFGDDIIVPRDAFEYTTSLLGVLGLKVNLDKTFGKGNFRESCGVDAWMGHDVTPPYLLEPGVVSDVAQMGSAVAVRNNFYRKGYWNVAYWLDDQYARWERFLPNIPAESLAAGRASFLGVDLTKCRIRYNRGLMREEVQVLIPIRKKHTGAMVAVQRLLQWFSEKPLPELRWSSGWTKDEAVYTRPGWVPKDFIVETGNTRYTPLDLA